MLRFNIGIGQYRHHSPDGGTTWFRSLREVPGRHTPIVRGVPSCIPSRPVGFSWDFVTVLPCGFGVATGHWLVDDSRRTASVFVTEDGGQRWRSVDWIASWPVEKLASLAVPARGCIALAWEDPWLHDGSESHVVCSTDGGTTWDYSCLGESNPYLALDHAGHLLALNDGYYLESRDGGRTWTRRDFVVEWPIGHRHGRVALLRQMTYPEPGTGYALVVHWRQGRMSEPTPDVGLLTTADNGSHWRHMHVFEGPNLGDVNERHVLDLRVE